MKKISHLGIFSITVLALALGAWSADKPESSVSIKGNIAKPQTWTAAQFETQFAKDAKTIKYTVKNANHSALAVPLLALINAAGPQLDPKIKNHSLRFVVVVEGSDGYMATFALSELMPEIGNHEAWIALDMDDKPLSDRDAPASLIVPSDQKPERWVHGIKAIRVVDINAPHKDVSTTH